MTALQGRLTPPATVVSLAVRAYSAAKKRGLDASSLLAADDALGIDSGSWRGELLALVREAWGLPGTHAYMEDGRWWVAEDGEVMLGDARKIYGGDTEAEALVAALEAAP